VLRYVNRDGVVVENFIGFVELQAVDAESIAQVILNHMRHIGLDLQKIIGQGYDGATTMSGHISGVQKRIRDVLPKAVYVHCAAYCLNLVINDQSKIVMIRNACDVMRDTIHFFRESPKRRSALGFNLPLFCTTRWTEKYKSIRIFHQKLDQTLSALENLATTDSSQNTRSKSFSLKCALEAPQTMYSITVMAHFSGYIEPLAQQLQSRCIDITAVERLISDTKRVISSARNCQTKPDEVYKKACESAGRVQLETPRVVARQQHRANVPFESPCDYYKKVVFCPYLDGLACCVL
jgi:hypothetical protein